MYQAQFILYDSQQITPTYRSLNNRSEPEPLTKNCFNLSAHFLSEAKQPMLFLCAFLMPRFSYATRFSYARHNLFYPAQPRINYFNFTEENLFYITCNKTYSLMDL
ncbi:hypothetical protein DC094_04370 [Pelagibaculum spongiae]|uniref:Uncharacterized protein n=1 Tax=Pelagibaculum spongiae TaxID=2080658 RepID=A0A2V1GYX8_9GAMM|nr:hypothetical protein DC094_04370 [Pelagibaculum spongiae]